MIDYFKDKKILVTGGTGFIGTNLVNRLKSEGAVCYKTLHKKDEDGNNWIGLEDNGISIDLCDTGSLKYMLKHYQFDYVFHCAAVTHGAKFINENPQALVVDNTIMNMNILDAAYSAGVKKFLFISSNTVYPELNEDYMSSSCIEDFYLKDDPPDCYFGVAHMKRYGEKLCEFYSTKVKNPMQCIVLRPSNIYGIQDDFNPETSHVMASMIKKVVDKQNPIEYWGNGNEERDLLYIDDFIDACLLTMEKVNKFDIFNVGSGQSYNLLSVLEEIVTQENFLESKVKMIKNKNTTIQKRVLDVSKLKSLGWCQRIEIEEGIRRTLRWHKKDGRG